MQQHGATGSPLKLLVQALQSIDATHTHTHPMAVWQIEDGEALWQICLRPIGQLRVTYLPLLERHVEQALGLMGIAGIVDATATGVR